MSSYSFFFLNSYLREIPFRIVRLTLKIDADKYFPLSPLPCLWCPLFAKV